MNKPTQYLLVGLPFSGKTTLVDELVKRLGFKSVNIDEIKKEFGYKALDDDHVPDKIWEKIFNEINKRVIKYLKNGFNVLTETAWVKREWRDKGRLAPSKEGFKTKVIYVVCTPLTARKRLLENRQTKKRFDVPDNIFEESIRDFEVPTKDEDVIIYDQLESLDKWIKNNFTSRLD